jgi:hypothetical protein
LLHIPENGLKNVALVKQRLETYSSQVFLFQGSEIDWRRLKCMTLSKIEPVNTMRESGYKFSM